MATGKRYFWIKLKDTFMTSDAVDFLMSQPDGANYVVLYQMLCLKTINTNGKLERHIGELIIPYDEVKIQRDTKWFTIDIVRVALNLYKALGLIYTDHDGALVLADYENLVGSETDWAIKKQRQRIGDGDNVPTNVPMLVPQNVPIEKEIRERDKRLEIDIDTDIEEKKNIKEKKKETDAFSAFAEDDDLLLAALRDFEKMRKSIKKPLTEHAKDLLLKKLQTFPPEQRIAILEQSIFNSWQGIFPLRDDKNDRRRPGRMDALMKSIQEDLQNERRGD